MEGVDVTNSYPTGKPALQASDHQSEVWFDNFIIQSVGNDLLDVPYYSQNDDRWGQDEYDAAHSWSEEITVDKWGCAVTSAAMVLKYYGIDQDPGTLNTWLKSQVDGYIRGGLLNWLAISRYSRIFGSTILEYRRGGSDTDVVDSDLENENPVILETSGEDGSHFVVTNGKLDPDYSILDPETEENTSLASFRSSRRLLPTHTNLSTLLIAFDNDLHMEIPAQGGDINQELPHGGGPFWLYQLDQPADGLYELRFRADNPGWYNLEIYGYDQDAEAQVRRERVYVDGEAVYQFEFNQEDGDLDGFHRQMTWDQMIADINLVYSQGWIRSERIWQSLLRLMQTGQRLANIGRMAQSNRTLAVWERMLRAYERGGLITPEASLFLRQELGYLRLSL